MNNVKNLLIFFSDEMHFWFLQMSTKVVKKSMANISVERVLVRRRP